jgi:hypothetical protein
LLFLPQVAWFVCWALARWLFFGSSVYIKAYSTIRQGHIHQHQNWMICNYALTFVAVTLRIWLPLLSAFVFHDFIPAYRVVSWLCWVPNLVIALIIINKTKDTPALASLQVQSK